MVGVSQIVACGVSTIPRIASGAGGGDVSVADIINETFVYNGVDNTFVLANPAVKVLNVFIDAGTYPGEVPAGATASVVVDNALLFLGNAVTIQYIR